MTTPRKKPDPAALIAERLVQAWQRSVGGLTVPGGGTWIFLELRDRIAETLDLVSCCSCTDQFHNEDE